MDAGWRSTRKTVSVRVDGAVPTPLMTVATLPSTMPATKEIKCTSPGCELDMFENHYTYDIDDDHTVADLSCPLCGGTDCLEEIEL
jgi:hypothetical protein